jgi:hypothetical protein
MSSNRRRGGASRPPAGDPPTDGTRPIRRGTQKGAQTHAEGAHGPKTHARIIEQLQQGPPQEPEEERRERERRHAAFHGKRRLVEPRVQHDEAEQNSERSQLFRAYQQGAMDDEPADNSAKLHGVFGHREHRSDYKVRGPDGLRVNRKKPKE